MTSGGPRKGAGRKPLPKKQRRTIAVQVRLTPDQKDWLDVHCHCRIVPLPAAEFLYGLLIEKGMPDDKETGFDTYVRQRRELEALRPRWTKTPPTKPGWYWALAAKWHMVEVLERDAKLRAFQHEYGEETEYDMAAFDGWAGPIEAPPVPEFEYLTEQQRALGRTHRKGQGVESVEIEAPPLPESGEGE
jgi:hypothetical protein